jgi:SAM-dependent methyltransferase
MSELTCRFCRAALSHVVVDLGSSPPANRLIAPDEPDPPSFPLCVYVCERCHLVQLPQYQSPAEIFSDYPYLSSYSSSWIEHLRAYAEMARERFALGPKSFVIEIASNDGALLKHFVDSEVPALGIEPAANVAAIALAAGVPTRSGFFGAGFATRLAAEGKRADLLVANNVLAHVPDINDFVEGLKVILKPGGVATLEFPHLLRLIDRTEFDTIYHEHFSYLSLSCAQAIFTNHGLTIFDVDELATHGGSLRLYAALAESNPAISPACSRIVAEENAAGLNGTQAYADFAGRVRAARESFVDFLKEAAADGKSVAGYGAPAKAATLLNYCGIGTELVPYTVDRNPHKQGKLIPGARVPIFLPERIMHTKPDYVVIFPWNIRDEVVAQMSGIRAWGGQFVVPIPLTRIVETR